MDSKSISTSLVLSSFLFCNNVDFNDGAGPSRMLRNIFGCFHVDIVILFRNINLFYIGTQQFVSLFVLLFVYGYTFEFNKDEWA